MKKIKVKIQGHPLTDPFGYSYFILSCLQRYYTVEISEDPEYLFYTDAFLDHYKYDCIKIYYTGENISPNFNACDYAISFDYCNFEDRHYRMPLYLVTSFYSKEELAIVGENYLNKNNKFTKEDLVKKTDFCSFIYSNYRSEIERKKIFEMLSSYKKVNSAGKYLNNTGEKKLGNKLKYEMNHKFSVAFENSSRSGYTTEKLVNSLLAQTIPIYWGNPHIDREFNTKRFINCHEYSSFDGVLEVVKKIDSDDDLYIQMINEPIASHKYNFDEVKTGFDIFVRNIIDQPIEKAKRRTINPVQAYTMKKNDALILVYTRFRSGTLAVLATIYKPFKKIALLEKIKQSYFQKKL